MWKLTRLEYAPLLFARSRRVGLLTTIAVLMIGAAALVPATLVDLPLGGGQRSAIPALLVPMLIAGLWGTCARSPSTVLERFIARRVMVWRRATWFLFASVLLVVSGVIPVVIAHASPHFAAVIGRNILLSVAITTAAACVFSQRIAWLAPLTMVIACWIFGTVDASASPAPWAIPNHDLDSGLAMWSSVTVWIGAGCWFVIADAKDVATAE